MRIVVGMYKQEMFKVAPFDGSFKLLLILLFLAIFTVIPNYLQRGRPQLAYFNKKGHRMCAPINVYLLNVLFPEEQVMNVCI